MRRSSINGKEPLYTRHSSSALPRTTSFRAPSSQQALVITTRHPDLPPPASSASAYGTSSSSSSSNPRDDDDNDENFAPESFPRRQIRMEQGDGDDYENDDEDAACGGGGGDDEAQVGSPVKKKLKAAGKSFGFKIVAIHACQKGGSHYEEWTILWFGTYDYRHNRVSGRTFQMNTPDKTPYLLLKELQKFSRRNVFTARVAAIINRLTLDSPLLIAYQYHLMRHQNHQNGAARGRVPIIFASDYMVEQKIADLNNGTVLYLPGLTMRPDLFRAEYFSCVSNWSSFHKAVRFPKRFGLFMVTAVPKTSSEDPSDADWEVAVVPERFIMPIVRKERTYNGSVHLPLVEKTFTMVSSTSDASHVCQRFLSQDAVPTIALTLTLLAVAMETPALTGHFGTRRKARNVGDVAGSIPCVTNPYQLFMQWQAVLNSEFSDPDIVRFIEDHANLAPYAGAGAEASSLGEVEQPEAVIAGIEGLFGEA